jgi:hydroxyacylglutathione hydrolase
MILEVRAVGPFYKNGFVIGCEETNEAVLVDPGEEIEETLAVVAEKELKILAILLTHAHIDHVAGVARAKTALRAPIYLHKAELPMYAAAVQQGLRFGIQIDRLPPVDVFYETAVAIPFGHYRALPHHTPGHTPGGVCLEIGKAGEPARWLFAGDTLFSGAIGRTDLPGGDYDTLIRSIRTVLFALRDEVEVFPGHGPTTTIGEERRTNPFLA